jgi:methylenetetrahydrofolate reductase (NADPH)
MDQFKWCYDAIRSAGITLPVDVGVMPVLDSASTINMALSHNACVMPRALCEIISRNWIFPNVFIPEESEEEIRRKKDAFMEEGIQYTISQINEYLSLGVNGIHLFTLNKADAVTRIIKESNLSA